MDQIGTLSFGGEEISIQVTTYSADGSPAIELYDEEGMPYTTFSVCLPGSQLQPDEVLVKTWSENEDLRQPMLDTGLFADTGRRVSSGFVNAEVWRFTKPN
jgi:hypothetical protein